MVTHSSNEALEDVWYSRLIPCCSTCYTRKGHSSSERATKISSGSHRIVVFGPKEVGKSKAISVLLASEIGCDYAPTYGSRTVKLTVGSADVQLVEVGSSLRPFWARALTSRTDAIWYMLPGDESFERELILFSDFMRECSSTITDGKMSVLVTVIGPTSSGDHIFDLVSKTAVEAGIYKQPLVEIVSDLSESALRKSITNLLLKSESH